MSENSATRAPDPGRIEATEPRAPRAAMTSARDGDFTTAPETGEGGLAAELSAIHQTTDRGRHHHTELTLVRREIVRQGRLDERVAASRGRDRERQRVNDETTITGALVAPAANATRSWTRWRPATTRSGSTCTTGTADSGGPAPPRPRR
ncbi:hypothetical protein [Streptomyces sp. NPDC058385]|uniref:hypothetical protein n=1 Tax=Streptomyces sp. NPDC058385 TaxID=3346473 RepID=UPI00365C895C